MTAVAPPPHFPGTNRTAWASFNPPPNAQSTMTADDVSKMLATSRKPASRSNSSSSLSSVASTSSTVTTTSTSSTPSTNPSSTNGDTASRKRASRYLWGMPKSEPTAGITTARPQSTTSISGPSATSAITAALQTPSQMANNAVSLPQSNGVRSLNESTPVLHLLPMNGTFERKAIQVPLFPDVIKIGRQTNAKTLPTPHNGYFDSKVLSRSHAEVWSDRNGKIWVRDIKSSNGTFVNGHRLSQENKESDPHELRENDMLELGIDIVSEDQKTVVHHKVSARVEHAGFMSSGALLDLNLADMDSQSQQLQIVNQAMGHMRRKSGQNDISILRGPNGLAAALPPQPAPQRPHNFLTGVNLESVIKRLSHEYKLAQQQSQELQRSSNFLDSILIATQPPKENLPQLSGLTTDPRRGSTTLAALPLKPRFCDPPNPPPQAPLPEKPLDLPANSMLKRAETEKPKLPNGPLSGSLRLDGNALAQIQSLSDALAVAKEEFDNQSKRLRDMENMLVEERIKREDAEARAKRLEQSNVVPKTPVEEGPSTPIEDEASSEIGTKPGSQLATEKLQRRLESLLVEFQEIKNEAEKWKKEKEVVEQERDAERTEKLSLMEMVEKLRTEEQQRLEKKQRKRENRKAAATSSTSDNVAEESTELDDDEDIEEINRETIKADNHSSRAKPAIFSNGHLSQLLHTPLSDTFTTTHRNSQGQLVQAAPYLSAMSVVLIGVAVMALVNKMSRGEN